MQRNDGHDARQRARGDVEHPQIRVARPETGQHLPSITRHARMHVTARAGASSDDTCPARSTNTQDRVRRRADRPARTPSTPPPAAATRPAARTPVLVTRGPRRAHSSNPVSSKRSGSIAATCSRPSRSNSSRFGGTNIAACACSTTTRGFPVVRDTIIASALRDADRGVEHAIAVGQHLRPAVAQLAAGEIDRGQLARWPARGWHSRTARGRACR